MHGELGPTFSPYAYFWVEGTNLHAKYIEYNISRKLCQFPSVAGRINDEVEDIRGVICQLQEV